MEKETIMVFKKKDGFTKEMNLPEIPFQPFRSLVEKDDNSIGALQEYNSATQPNTLNKKIDFRAVKILTTIYYEQI